MQFLTGLFDSLTSPLPESTLLHLTNVSEMTNSMAFAVLIYHFA